MPLELTALELAALPAAVAKVCGPAVPPPAKMMAAKGLAPMGPHDLATTLYQLSRDGDDKVAEAALTTAEKLPDNILAAALKEPLDPRVLDFFAKAVVSRVGAGSLIEAVLLNRATHDETFVTLAGELAERELEILAGNQERLLRCPAIIEAFYFNKRARMSTVDRLLEMAVRHGLQLENIPQFAEIAAHIFGQGGDGAEEEQAGIQTTAAQALSAEQLDATFSDALDTEWDEEVGRLDKEADTPKVLDQAAISKLPVNAKIRLATLGTASQRGILIKDAIRPVAMAAITSPAISEQEVIKYAADRSLSEDVIREITRKKDWQKNYQIKLNLTNNPKTPMAVAMRYLGHLRAPDLRAIARSKSVPSALATQARRMVQRKN